MEQYKVSKQMQSDIENHVIGFLLAPSVTLFRKMAEELADKHAISQSEAERDKVKEYFRRKVLNSKVEDGIFLVGKPLEINAE